ncbi:16S rRNA (cytosine(1402)-N(4))-methyltransferase RsmH [Candidatus Zixiibacteriota bacterium]
MASVSQAQRLWHFRVYHSPVLAETAIEWLVSRADGRYLDGTVGGGGHLAVLLDVLGEGAEVLALDRDPEALQESAGRIGQGNRVILRQGAFADLARITEEEGMLPLDGILLDLGVSSFQLDEPERGFTYRVDAPLDMRMDPDLPISAADLIADESEQELGRILREFGEVRDARGLARRIVQARKGTPLERSGDLRGVIEAGTPPHRHMKVLSQVFQALRIAVNDELGQLKQALTASIDVLRPGGRLVVIAYHSLEDRIVKEFFRMHAGACTCPPGLPVCACGAESLIEILTRKVVKVSQEEISRNPRARSARLRVAERLAVGSTE